MRDFSTLLVTGGAGFIGSNFIRYVFDLDDFKGRIVNLDALTYAGNLFSLEDVAEKYFRNYCFEKIDIADRFSLESCLKKHEPDVVVHFAAQSHVDRSIYSPDAFVKSNVLGTFNLLEILKTIWKNKKGVLFHHVSTDEVYGSLDKGFFFEASPYAPTNPYSASKAASDHLVKSYIHTYNFPATLSKSSNNYGPYQIPEKLIPLMIRNMLEKKKLPIYGTGDNIRDWLHVYDHCSAIWEIITKAKIGKTYNIAGENEWTNIDLVTHLCKTMANKQKKDPQVYLDLIRFVKDRPGHDKRYAINCDKIKEELGWRKCYSFEAGIKETVDWYLENKDWLFKVG